MKTTKITEAQADEMRQPFLNSAAKKRLGITGYQMVTEYGWHIERETDMAVLLTGVEDEGDYYHREQKDVELWLPKSQIKAFEYETTDEDDFDEVITEIMIFVKTWLFNQEKSTIKINHF